MNSLTKKLAKIWEYINLTLFPESKMEKMLRNIKAENFFQHFPRLHFENDGTEALLPYRERNVQELVELIKYRKNAYAIELAGKILYEEILGVLEEELESGLEIIVIGIPASPRRIHDYGFNQTDLIAEKIAENSGGIIRFVKNALLRNKAKRSQTEMKSRKERLNNMRDAFRVGDNSLVAGKRVLVIDDVFTTGATMKDARRALRAAGAKKIWCFALAH